MERSIFIKLTRLRNAIRHSPLTKEQIDQILDETIDTLNQSFNSSESSESSENKEAARIEQILKESNSFWEWDRVKQYVSIITTILLYFNVGNTTLITLVALSPSLTDIVKIMIKKPFSYDTYLKLTSTIISILGKSKVFGIPMLKIKKEGRRSRRKNKQK
jgi:hypothetical protein